MIKKLTIIGVGLIGGSLARALRARGKVGEIIGHNREERHLKRAVELGVIDRYEMDMANAVRGSDVVLLAVPVGAMRSVFEDLAGHLGDGAIVTDVGSSKGSVVEAAQQVYGKVPDWFVPGHPIAGIETSGVEASFAELFERCRVILTPLPHTSHAAVAKVRAMWECVGAIVEEVDVQHHDSVLAATSHLPHLLAFALVDTLATMDDKQEMFRFAAGGFRDFTRIASSDPMMWHDICVNNQASILRILRRFQDDLRKLSNAIENNDGGYLLDTFTRAKQARDMLADDGDLI